MSTSEIKAGYASINHAQIYYEMAGKGTPFVMIHAGVADSRQWNNEFSYFAQNYQVVRYDMRGYGRSEPVDGEFSHMGDLVSLLDILGLHEPLIIMGCSMGGGLAMDFALASPSRVKALIMVDAGPSGLELDVETPSKFADAEKAFNAGNLDLVAEIETQIWFDGMDRTSEQVNQPMRKLLYEMDRLALSHEMTQLGKRLPDTETPAFDRLQDLAMPVLIIVGTHDTPYILAAAEYMSKNIQSSRMIRIEDAAHLPNMDHPRAFQSAVSSFLESLSS